MGSTPRVDYLVSAAFLEKLQNERLFVVFGCKHAGASVDIEDFDCQRERERGRLWWAGDLVDRYFVLLLCVSQQYS